MPRSHVLDLERAVSFPPAGTPGATLTGQWAAPPPGGPSRALVVCHPHPLYAGNLLNHIVTRIVETAGEAGWGTLRFNFRGVGRSTGEFSDGLGEQDDARGAIEFVKGQGVRKVALAGYSFGAAVALAVTMTESGIVGLLSVAHPLPRWVPLLGGQGGTLPCPALFVAGSADEVADLTPLRARFKGDPLARWRVIEAGDHFFKAHRSVAELQEAVGRFLGEIGG